MLLVAYTHFHKSFLKVLSGFCVSLLLGVEPLRLMVTQMYKLLLRIETRCNFFIYFNEFFYYFLVAGDPSAHVAIKSVATVVLAILFPRQDIFTRFLDKISTFP
jgi:hypothetical protein